MSEAIRAMDFYSTKDIKDMTVEEIELQYSPTKWSKLFKGDPREVIEHHMDVVSRASDEARHTIPCEIGIEYGPTSGQKLDIYGGNALPNDAPILVHFHGGYWQALSRDMTGYVALALFRSGIRVVVVGYELAPAVSVAELNEQIKSAITYVVNLATKLGSSSISFSGHSAGAQIVMQLLNSEWLANLNDNQRNLIKSLHLMSGMYDLTPLVCTHVNQALKMTHEDAVKASPIYFKGREFAVKIVVSFGEFDTPEYKRQSLAYAKKLKVFNSQVETVIVPQVDHFELMEHMVEDDYILTKKIVECVRK